jgi:aryl-alcohol dehydrogenase-like predicted oxidoreductase
MRRNLGVTGPALFPLGLGCMGMSEGYGAPDEREAIATIQSALDRGVNFIDTADIYGPHSNELLVGHAIRGRRSEVVLATKFGFVTDPVRARERELDGRPEYVRQACEASLRRLGVEVIDLLYLHRLDPAVPIEETVGAMAELLRAGKVRYLGLSEIGVETLRRAHSVHPISALQSEYSLWTRDPERNGTLDACAQLGITFVPFSPLGRGFLTGAIRSPNDFEADDMRRENPRFQGENFAHNLRLVEKVKALAAERECTPAQFVLAWLLGKAAHIVPIPGTKRRARLEENLAAAGLQLAPEDYTTIDAMLPPDAFAGERYPESMLALVER